MAYRVYIALNYRGSVILTTPVISTIGSLVQGAFSY